MIDTGKFLDFTRIKNTFPYYPSLISVILAMIFIYASIDGFLTTYIEDRWIRLLVYIVLILSWVVFWAYHRINPSKNVKDKIGIVICIKTENDKQRVRLKNDFISRMWELIGEHNLNDLVNIVPLNEFHTNKLFNLIFNYNKLRREDQAVQSKHPLRKKWDNESKKIKGHFYIWGTIKERSDKEPNYIFDINGRVIHAPIKINVPNPLEIALNKVWARRILFKETFETHGFILAADVIMLGVQYIIGLAALISKDPLTALKVHEESLKDFKKHTTLPPNLKEVKKELIKNLIDECQILSRQYFLDNNEIKAKGYLNKSFNFDPNSYDGLIMKSIYDFVYDNDIKEAIRTCYKAKKYAKENGTWKYNLAFLFMHLEKFDEALKWYRDIISNSYEGENITLEEVYDFNKDYVQNNPHHIQSLFIIGYLKYNKSNNYPESHDYLTSFVDKTQNNIKYDCLIKEANKIIEILKNKMALKN